MTWLPLETTIGEDCPCLSCNSTFCYLLWRCSLVAQVNRSLLPLLVLFAIPLIEVSAQTCECQDCFAEDPIFSQYDRRADPPIGVATSLRGPHKSASLHMTAEDDGSLSMSTSSRQLPPDVTGTNASAVSSRTMQWVQLRLSVAASVLSLLGFCVIFSRRFSGAPE